MRTHTSRGFALIELLMVVAIIGIVGAIAVPALLRARIAANEASAIGTVRAINSAETSYSASAGQGGFGVLLATLATPCAGGVQAFLSPDLSTDPSLKSGYTITLAAGAGSLAGPADCNGTATQTAYYATATPLTFGGTGNRAFASNSINAIWQDTTGVPPLEPFTLGPTTTPIQ